MEFPKINTLFVRDENTHKVKPPQLCLPEVTLIKEWLVTEKIDGMNIRVEFCTGSGHLQGVEGPVVMQPLQDPYIRFLGRTDAAQVPAHLLAYLTETFTIEKLRQVFDTEAEGTTGVLFGEGYGEKIQSGGKYRKGASFRLFDVVVFSPTGRLWWLEWENVENIADGLGIKTVPVLFEGVLDLEDIIRAVRHGFGSDTAQQDYGRPVIEPAEGIVARTRPLLFKRNGERLVWKLKTKDF